MAVRLAKKAGFCMGVRRALNLTLDSAFGRGSRVRGSDHRIYTLGPLIHNPQVVALLREYGIVQIESPTEAANSPVIVRAHGVPPSVRRELRDCGAKIFDATCPRVARVQAVVKKKSGAGAFVFIAGDAGHAEVVGLEGYAVGQSVVVRGPEDVEQFDPAMVDRFDANKVCLVAQTTYNRDKYDEIARAVSRRWPAVEVFDTLCASTDERQAEVGPLAKWADAIVVVGGRDSANTARLVDVVIDIGRPVFHIEAADELDESELVKFRNVGVTAGASTPNWLIQDVVERLHTIQANRPGGFRVFRRAGRRMMQIASDLGLMVSVGAGCMTYAACKLQGISGEPDLYLMSALYVFAMVMFSNLAAQAAVVYSEPRRGRFYQTHRLGLLALAGGSATCAALLALRTGWLPFVVMILAIGLGISYIMPGLPEWLMQSLGKYRLRDLPASKDIATALGWASVCSVVPHLAYGSSVSVSTVMSFMFVAVIVFIRSVLVAIKRIQGDRLVGIETIPTVVGIKTTKILLVVLAVGYATSLLCTTSVGLTPPVGYGLVVCVAYACVYLYLYHERIIFQGMPFESVVDGNFILAGIIALLTG